MVGRAGRCGVGWSVGSGLREQKGDQVGEREVREFRTGLTETLVPTHPGLVLAVPRLCPPTRRRPENLEKQPKSNGSN